MTRPRLRECGDAARLQHAAEFAQHVVGVRRVMERIEAEDALDARIRQVDAAPVENEEARLGTLAERRLLRVQLARDGEGGRRDVEEDHAAAELGEVTREPPRAGAVFEDGHARRELQSLQYGAEADEELR